MMVSLLTLLLSLEVLLLLLESSRFPWDFGSRELKGNIYSLVLMHSLLEDWMTKQWRMTRECSVVCSAHVSYDTYHGFLWTILLAEWQFVCWLHWIVLLCVVSVLTILLHLNVCHVSLQRRWLFFFVKKSSKSLRHHFIRFASFIAREQSLSILTDPFDDPNPSMRSTVGLSLSFWSLFFQEEHHWREDPWTICSRVITLQRILCRESSLCLLSCRLLWY